MAGAEGERGFDFDADAVWRNAGAVVCAVHDEAAGRNGLEPDEAFGNPIFGGDRGETKCLGRFCTGRRPDQRAQRLRIGFGAGMNVDAPMAPAFIHKADGDGIGREALGDKIRNFSPRMFRRCEHGDGGFGRLGGHWIVSHFRTYLRNSQGTTKVHCGPKATNPSTQCTQVVPNRRRERDGMVLHIGPLDRVLAVSWRPSRQFAADQEIRGPSIISARERL